MRAAIPSLDKAVPSDWSNNEKSRGLASPSRHNSISRKGISPVNSINYYKAVAAKLGGVSTLQDKYRLFMLPGMDHCRGGEGPDTFDALGAMDQWVEHKKAPDRIVASRVRDGKTDRTRPLCPYPQVAVYSGSGSTDDAANFTCKVQ